MRWALRNQDKIKTYFEPFGDDVLTRIKESLNKEFAENKDVEKHIEKVDGHPYPILTINDTGHTFGIIMFYVIKKSYDVYLLAFKEFVS